MPIEGSGISGGTCNAASGSAQPRSGRWTPPPALLPPAVRHPLAPAGAQAHLLAGRGHLESAIRAAVEAQVLPVGVTLLEKGLHLRP